jgi:hypothetical protein
MYIEKLERKSSGSSVTVTMNYNEMMDLLNAMYHYCKNHPDEDGYISPTAKQTFADMSFIKDVVKHGALQEDTVEHFREANQS